MKLASFQFVAGGSIAVPLTNSLVTIAREKSTLLITSIATTTQTVVHMFKFETDGDAARAYDLVVNLYTDRGDNNLVLVPSVLDYDIA